MISSTEVKVLGQDTTVLTAKYIILATGSEPRPFPAIPFSSRILCSTGILNLETLPKKLAIIGGGVIGCEFASLFHTLGVEITIIEVADHILAINNADISKTMQDKFSRQGIRVLTKASLQHLEDLGSHVKIIVNGQTEEYDVVLIAIGRQFNTETIGLDNAGVIRDERGIIPVDDTMRTNVPNIFAIGDITGKWLLAHTASHQGNVAARNAAGHHEVMDYSAVPAVIFTFPEVATVGLSLEAAQQQNIPAKLTKFPFRAIGKAVAMGEADGFAAIISHETTQQILGAYVIGPHAASLIAEMTLAIRNELTHSCRNLGRKCFISYELSTTLTSIWEIMNHCSSKEAQALPKKKQVPNRLPPWFKQSLPQGSAFYDTEATIKHAGIATVCEEALCPNRTRCWSRKTATYLALGDACTRRCGFCNIHFTRKPQPPDPKEPDKIAQSAKMLQLKHIVLTMVARDDLEDGGASALVNIIHSLHQELPKATIEVLASDFQGNLAALHTLLDSPIEDLFLCYKKQQNMHPPT